jgi:hypothetical protein
MLKERGYYTIELEGGKTIPIRFSTWTLMRFCELKNNISLQDLFKIFGSGGATLTDFILLIKSASECVALENNKEFSPSQVEVCGWIDDMGGMSSEKFKELISVMAGSMQGEDTKKNMKAV